MSLTKVIESLELRSRLQLAEHQRDAFEALLDFFAALMKLLVSTHTTQLVLDRNEQVMAALRREKEQVATLKVKLELEAAKRGSTERLGESAVAAVDYWRRKASENSQRCREVDEARAVAHEAALFWKARAVCATAAVKHLTAEEFD